MAQMSNYLEDNLLDHVLRGDTGGTSFAQPATIYLAFHTEDPLDDGTGDEVTGGSYARKLLSFAAASGGSSVSSTAATYTNMPTTDVTHLALWDSLSSGNLIMRGELDTPISFNSGDEATVQAGAITVEFD